MPAGGRQCGDTSVLSRSRRSPPHAVRGKRLPRAQFSQVVIYAIAMLGLNILTGFNGQISLGQGAFYGIGAYTTAILLDETGIPYWGAMPIQVRSA